MLSVSFEKTVLDNGLNVITHVDNSLPIIAVNVWYHVGSKNEQLGKTGFAHLFEHVMFEGSKNHNKDYFEPLQKIGADINGSTTTDRTNYWENIPSNYLDLALWLESDRMGFLLEALDQERFDLQREVVKNERRQSYENQPYGIAQLKLQEALFPSPHPYHWPTIGSQEDLNKAELNDVKDFFRHFYHPSNASITIAGDIDHKKVLEKTKRYFGDIAPGQNIDRINKMGSSLSGENRIEITDSVPFPRIYMAWPTVPNFTKTQAALDILSIILSDGKSSRLSKKMVHESQMAHDVEAYHHSQEISGEFHIIATANPAHSLKDLETTIEEELNLISTIAPSEEELVRAKNRIESYSVHRLEKIGGFGGKADQLNFYNIMAKDPAVINTDINRYRNITTEDIKSAANTLLENHIRLYVYPKDVKSSTKVNIDRSIMPKESSKIKFDPPIVEKIDITPKQNILLINKPSLPIVSVGVLMDTGIIDEHTSKFGLSKLTTDMLFEGTKNRTSMKISEDVEFFGSQTTKQTAREYSYISINGLSEHINQNLEILSDILQNPIFPKQDFERMKNERLADIEISHDDPDLVANTAIRSIIYGVTSKYGHPGLGLEKTIESLHVDDVEKHYHEYIKSNTNTSFLIVGDMEKSTSNELIVKSFDEVVSRALSQSTPVKNILRQTHSENTISLTENTIYLIDNPEAAQSVIRVGCDTVSRNHEDYNKISLLNYILGGDYSSRLNLNLRQDKGYSYGFYSSISWHNNPSLWVCRGSVQTEVTKESIVEILKEISEIKTITPVSKPEFENAKQSILKGMPSQFQTNGQLMSQIIKIAAYDLPVNYFQNYINDISSIDHEMIVNTAEKHINGNNLAIVVVGDAKKIKPSLESLNMPIIHSDPYGNLIN